jgi:hypothetical protein
MRCVSVLMALLLSLPFSPLLPAQDQPPKLNLVIVEGDGAINNVRQRTAREPIVQVEDENHKPVAGAVVVFALQSGGPGGTFANGASTLTVVTNEQGQAVAHGFVPNSVKGNFEIHVTASHGGSSATGTIHQSNAAGAAAGSSAGAAAAAGSGKLVAIIAVAAAAVAGGAVYAATHSGGGGNNTTTPATTISAGAGTIGPPK